MELAVDADVLLELLLRQRAEDPSVDHLRLERAAVLRQADVVRPLVRHPRTVDGRRLRVLTEVLTSMFTVKDWSRPIHPCFRFSLTQPASSATCGFKMLRQTINFEHDVIFM